MQFGWLDWAVLIAFLGGLSVLGKALAGRQKTVRDFFLGGRRLPWYAVSASVIATEISAVTFVSVPALVFEKGGNFTYLQLALGAILARILIGYVFCPIYYRREIYSPYQFIGEKLGRAASRMTSGLFLLGALLAQGSRIFLAGLVLEVVTGIGLGESIVLVSIVSFVWTLMGGIRLVVWTDAIQFAVMVLGGMLALGFLVIRLPGGFSEYLAVAAEHGKFRLLDLSLDGTVAFTLWAGLLGTTFLNLGFCGTDQILVQRLLCCRDERAARVAILSSSVGILFAVVMLAIGAGLFCYYQAFPMPPELAVQVGGKVDRVFPLFIVHVLPAGLRGLVVASILAAALSTATSAMAAMGQTLMSAAEAFRGAARLSEKGRLALSKVLVGASAAGLALMAFACSRMEQYPDILTLALSMATYTSGAILGTFLFALQPRGRDARGLLWGVPISILTVVVLHWGAYAVARWIVGVALSGVVFGAGWALRREPEKILWVLLGAALPVFLAFVPIGRMPAGELFYVKLAWPWHFPLATAITLGMGYLLGRRPGFVPRSTFHVPREATAVTLNLER